MREFPKQFRYVSPKAKEKIIEAFERLTLQLDKGYWREKHTSHHDSHQGKSKLRSFKRYLGKV